MNFGKKKLFFCILILNCSTNLFSKEPLTNISITDGDSLRGVFLGENIKIRLAEIDAPEIKQPFGLESKGCLTELVKETNNIIFFRFKEKDRYGRHVGWIYSKDVDLNLEMVKLGCAWVYNRYAKRKVLFKFQDAAKERRIGLWSARSPVAPWVWRKKN